MIWLELASSALSFGVLGFALGRHYRPRVAMIAPLAVDGIEAHWADVAAGLTHAELCKRVGK